MSNIVQYEGDSTKFISQLKTYQGLIIGTFGAPRCPTCKRLQSLLPNVAKDHPDNTFIKVNVDANQELAQQFDVQSIPKTIFWKFEGDELKTLDTLMGGDINKLKETIPKLK